MPKSQLYDHTAKLLERLYEGQNPSNSEISDQPSVEETEEVELSCDNFEKQLNKAIESVGNEKIWPQADSTAISFKANIYGSRENFQCAWKIRH